MTEAAARPLVLMTTAGSEEQAAAIARALVERRLAACVTVLPTNCSIYRWQGKLVEEEEKLLLVKTAERLFPRVRDAIRELHSYDVPEVLALQVADGDPNYLRWLAESVADDA